MDAGTTPETSTPTDSGTSPDTSTPVDAGTTPDTSTPMDSGPADTGTAADGSPDSGSPTDAGAGDSGAPDTGAGDAGAPDAGHDAGITANVIFATSTLQSADLGGLSGADALCAARATAAGLPGTFVAWLSTSTVTASARLGNAARGWVRTDGLPFADTAAQVGQLMTYYPPSLDEFGHSIPSGDTAFTGVATNGSTLPTTATTCADWTDGTSTTSPLGGYGYPNDGTSGWSINSSEACNVSAHIYCMEIDKSVPVSPAPPPAGSRTVFESSTVFNPASGIAAADTICSSEATTARLSGNYLALLATTTATASSRFVAGSAWYRPDGVEVFPTLTALTDANLMGAITVTADGASNVSEVMASGATNLFTAAVASSDCSDWSVSTGSTYYFGVSTSTNNGFFRQATLPCSSLEAHVYCLQQ